MVINLQDWLVVFRSTETEQRVKIRVEAGNPVAAIDAASKALEDGFLGGPAWLLMESCIPGPRRHLCVSSPSCARTAAAPRRAIRY